METSVKIGAVFIILFLALGIFQSFDDTLPKSSLAGAAVLEPKSQEEINGCMVDCMRECVTDQSLVPSCTAKCEPQCGMSYP